MKFHAGRATLLHVDRRTNEQTNMTKLTVTFCNFRRSL